MNCRSLPPTHSTTTFSVATAVQAESGRATSKLWSCLMFVTFLWKRSHTHEDVFSRCPSSLPRHYWHISHPVGRTTPFQRDEEWDARPPASTPRFTKAALAGPRLLCGGRQWCRSAAGDGYSSMVFVQDLVLSSRTAHGTTTLRSKESGLNLQGAFALTMLTLKSQSALEPSRRSEV